MCLKFLTYLSKISKYKFIIYYIIVSIFVKNSKHKFINIVKLEMKKIRKICTI